MNRQLSGGIIYIISGGRADQRGTQHTGWKQADRSALASPARCAMKNEQVTQWWAYYRAIGIWKECSTPWVAVKILSWGGIISLGKPSEVSDE